MHIRRSRSAAGMVEYSLIAALVSLALIVILAMVGTSVTGVFQRVINGFSSASAPTSLIVNIANADAATPAVTVTGPAGYTKAITSSTTLINLNPGSYTVTATPIVGKPSQSAVFITYYPTYVVGTTSSQIPAIIAIPNAANTVVVDYANAVPATTHVIAGADLSLFTAITSNSSSCGATPAPCATTTYALTYSGTPSFGPINVGDALVFSTSTLTPAGLMVKVTAATSTLINATQAAVSDVFVRLSYTGSAAVPPASYSYGPFPATTTPHASSPVSFGCGSTNPPPTFTSTYTPSITFDLIHQFNYPWLDQSGDKFGLIAHETDTFHFDINSNGLPAGLFCQVSFPTGLAVDIPPITFAIGVIPVVLTQKLSLNATALLSWTPAGNQPWFSADVVAHSTVGFVCVATPTAHCDPQLAFNINPPVVSVKGQGSLTIKFGPRYDMKLYGVAGIYMALYGYDEFVGVTNLSPTCYNDEVGLAFSEGLAAGFPVGPFSNLWSLQLAEQKWPLYCLIAINRAPDFLYQPGSPLKITGPIDVRGCANPGCISTDGYNTPGNRLGPGQIVFRPDNALPRGTVEDGVQATLPFTNVPAGSGPNSCDTDPEPNGPGTGHFCPWAIIGFGRTGYALNGNQIGRWAITDSNGYVYLAPTNTVLFGSVYGYDHGGSGCNGNECVDGMQFNSYCRSAAGAKESCAGHSLRIQIWVESNGKTNYANGGDQNYPEQWISWFDGIQVGISSTAASNGPFIQSNAASPAWTCTPSFCG